MIRNRFKLSSIIPKFFALIFIIGLTHVGNAASLDPLLIVDGISSICPRGIGNVAGIPGPIEIFSSSATGPVPIVSGDEDANPSFAVVGVASTSSNGRIVALGHDGFFINFAMSLKDFGNEKFGINIINWLQNSQSNKKVLITTGHGEPWVGGSDYEDFRNALKAQGYDVVITPGKITSDTLSTASGASILLISCAGPSLTDEEIGYIRSFVNRGGGLFMQGLGWSWVQYQHLPLEDCPMNKLAEPYGFRWIDGYISDSQHNYNGAPIFSLFFPDRGKVLNVPFFNQGKTKWCVFNCISMVLQYYGVNTYPWNLAEDFDLPHDSDVIPSRVVNRLKRYIMSIPGKDLSVEIQNLGPLYHPDPAEIADELDQNAGTPLIFMLGWPQNHAIVVVGYSIVNGEKDIYIHDPGSSMFKKIPYPDFLDKIKTGFHILFKVSGKRDPPEANYYIIDRSIKHSIYNMVEDTYRTESFNYLDKGNKYVIDRSISIFPYPATPIAVDGQVRWLDGPLGEYKEADGNLEIDCYVMNPHEYSVNAKLDVNIKRNNEIIYHDSAEREIESGLKNPHQTNQLNIQIPLEEIGAGHFTICLEANNRVITNFDIIVISKDDVLPCAFSPVDLELTDPSGLIVNKELNITNDIEYIQLALDSNSDSDAMILVHHPKEGYYKIKVLPKNGANPKDIYSFSVFSRDKTISFAESVPIKYIPDKPYVFEINDGKVYLPLFVEKKANPIASAPGSLINFVINITNTGTMPLDHVQVIDHLPDGLSYISDNRSGAVSGRNITWNILTSFDKGKSILIKLVTRIDINASGNLTNIVEVTGISATEKQEEVSNSVYSTVRVVDVKEPKVRQNVEHTKIGNQVAMATGNGRAINNIKVVSN